MIDLDPIKIGALLAIIIGGLILVYVILRIMLKIAVGDDEIDTTLDPHWRHDAAPTVSHHAPLITEDTDKETHPWERQRDAKGRWIKATQD